MKTAIITFNSAGDKLGERLRLFLKADLYSKSSTQDFNISAVAGNLMREYKAIIFISSTGIAVRAIAPYIKSKTEDPAVVVIDVFGKYAISLLSGHLGGANELTERIAAFIGAVPVITTATDGLGIKAPDMLAKENELIIDDLKAAKNIAAMLLDNEKVGFSDDRNIISVPKGYSEELHASKGLVAVTHKLSPYELKKDAEILKLVRKDIVLGIGCRKGYNSETMKNKVLKKLEEYNIDCRSVKAVATIELKKEERAIIDLADCLNAELKIFTAEEIEKLQYKYKGSTFVEKTVGVKAVCEPCAELCGARLLTGKLALEGMTLCIGELI